MNLKTITIKEYLTHKGIAFKEQNEELITHCLFNDCDKDSKGNEAHLYFNTETGQYNCKKCGAKGNIITLAKYLGDSINGIALSPRKFTRKENKNAKFDPVLVEKCHKSIPDHIRQYLHARGITDALIGDYKLGWGKFYDKYWITFPIKNENGNFIFLKLRQDPNKGNEKMGYPKGIKAQIYDWDTLKNADEKIMICEGESDRLLLISKGIPTVTSTHGAMTFKEEWVEKFKQCQKIYICLDNDDTGRK